MTSSGLRVWPASVMNERASAASFWNAGTTTMMRLTGLSPAVLQRVDDYQLALDAFDVWQRELRPAVRPVVRQRVYRLVISDSSSQPGSQIGPFVRRSPHRVQKPIPVSIVT